MNMFSSTGSEQKSHALSISTWKVCCCGSHEIKNPIPQVLVPVFPQVVSVQGDDEELWRAEVRAIDHVHKRVRGYFFVKHHQWNENQLWKGNPWVMLWTPFTLRALLSRSPNYILMENVKGFETSDTREQFVRTLKTCGYTYQEFLLSPTQLGIPNSRLRYYLLAKKKPLQFHFVTRDEIMESFPCITGSDRSDNQCSDRGRDCVPELGCTTNEVKSNGLLPALECSVDSTHGDKHNKECLKCLQVKGDSGLKPVHDEYKNCRKIGDYLEEGKGDNYFEKYLLPAKVLSKFALLLDIVNRQSERSCCFTKAYGHYAEGTGSVLKMADIDDTEIFERYRDVTDDQSKSELLSVLKLRYFTPREVANLHGFPSDFCFPSSVSVKQQYRLLGNSLNVHVVSELLNCLFQSPAWCEK